MNTNDIHRLLTISAFAIGYALIPELSSTEQNAVGNFFMLIGQTLSTNSSFNFNATWQNINPNVKINEKDLLKKVNEIFNNTINNIK